MPMVVVGAVVEGRNQLFDRAWVCWVNANPPMIGIALGKRHHTNKGIREHKEFGISIPGVDLIRAVDYVGLVSGGKGQARNEEFIKGVESRFFGQDDG